MVWLMMPDDAVSSLQLTNVRQDKLLMMLFHHCSWRTCDKKNYWWCCFITAADERVTRQMTDDAVSSLQLTNVRQDKWLRMLFHHCNWPMCDKTNYWWCCFITAADERATRQMTDDAVSSLQLTNVRQDKVLWLSEEETEGPKAPREGPNIAQRKGLKGHKSTSELKLPVLCPSISRAICLLKVSLNCPSICVNSVNKCQFTVTKWSDY
jgi:hypothetical protein